MFVILRGVGTSGSKCERGSAQSTIPKRSVKLQVRFMQYFVAKFGRIVSWLFSSLFENIVLLLAK